MLTRAPTRLEREWLELCYQIPCIVCKHFHAEPNSPSEYHHIVGRNRPKAHLNGICLCARHHRLADNQHPKRWISRHGDGRRLFEQRYAPERELFELQKIEVEALKLCRI